MSARVLYTNPCGLEAGGPYTFRAKKGLGTVPFLVTGPLDPDDLPPTWKEGDVVESEDGTRATVGRGDISRGNDGIWRFTDRWGSRWRCADFTLVPPTRRLVVTYEGPADSVRLTRDAVDALQPPNGVTRTITETD